jgi:hypothetical protein
MSHILLSQLTHNELQGIEHRCHLTTFLDPCTTRNLQHTQCFRVTPGKMIVVEKIETTALWMRKSAASQGRLTFRNVSDGYIVAPQPYSLCQGLEPLLMGSTRRFVLFPIQYPDVSRFVYVCLVGLLTKRR